MCIRSGDGHVGIHDGRPYFSCGVSRRSMEVLPIAFAMVSYTHPFLRPIISSPANPLYFPSPHLFASSPLALNAAAIMDHLRAHRCSFLLDVSSIPSSERIIIPKTLKKNSSLFTTFLLVTASKKFDRWLENVKLVEGSYCIFLDYVYDSIYSRVILCE